MLTGTPRAFVALAVLALAACRPAPRLLVDRAELRPGGGAGALELELGEAELGELLRQRVVTNPRFELENPAKPAAQGRPRLRLMLEVASGLSDDDSAGPPQVEVAVQLEVRQRAEADPLHLRLDATATERIPTGGTSDAQGRRLAIRGAARRAFQRAVDQALRAAESELGARSLSEAKLVAQLSAPDPLLREAAVHALVEKGSSAAVPALLGELRSEDPIAVRRAIGDLVRLKDPRAVPALIELSRGKQAGFEREIIAALEEIGGDEAQAYLYTVSQGHDLANIREAARSALETITARQMREVH